MGSFHDNEQANRAADLLERVLDRTIEDAEVEELRAIWTQCPALEREAREAFRIERLLQCSRDLKRSLNPDGLRALDAACRRKAARPEPVPEPEAVPNIYTDAYFAAAYLEAERLEAQRRARTPVPSATPRKREKNKPSFYVLILLLLVVFGVGVYTEFFVDSSPEVAVDRFRPRSIARVEAVLDVQWKDGAEPLKEGRQVGADTIRFDEGIVQLVFQNGVRIAVRGPADFRLNTRKKMFLAEGRLSATVPTEGKGFEVATPFLSAVDLGTEFQLEVEGHQVEAHTIQGKIELHGVDDKRIELPAGSALRLDADGLISRFAAEPNRFLTDLFVAGMQRQRDEKYLGRWKESREKILQMPGLRLFYDFEESNGRVLNHADPSQSGSLAGAKRCQGRWAGKKACSFYRPSAAVDLALPEPMTSATLDVSFRLDSFSRFNHVLLGSRDSEAGNYVWQIFNDGSIQLAIRPEKDAQPLLYRTAPIFTAGQTGAWYRLTTVVDTPKKEVRTYIDGVLRDTQPIDMPVPLRLDRATLGNLQAKKKMATDSHLSGCIDQLLIFNRPLTDEEITAFAAGLAPR